MDCPSCMELFDDKEHLPLNLDCGHSYCHLCMSKMMEEYNQKRCPECRDPITKPLKDLTPNLTVLQILSEKKRFEKYKKLCSTHIDYFLDFQCKQCQIDICKLCLISHSGHLVIPLNHSKSKLRKQVIELKSNLNKFLLEIDLKIKYNSQMLDRVINHHFLRNK